MDRHTINLEFFASYELFEQIPSLNCQEIAFVGASNSGKSSAINLLANNKKLSYTSKKPGKTKLFNYFKKDNNFIVDFPGYGFANISKSQIKSWQRELPRYFEKRENSYPSKNDTTGESMKYDVIFDFPNGDNITLQCSEWSEKIKKKNNWISGISVAILTKEFVNWITNY